VQHKFDKKSTKPRTSLQQNVNRTSRDRLSNHFSHVSMSLRNFEIDYAQLL